MTPPVCARAFIISVNQLSGTSAAQERIQEAYNMYLYTLHACYADLTPKQMFARCYSYICLLSLHTNDAMTPLPVLERTAILYTAASTLQREADPLVAISAMCLACGPAFYGKLRQTVRSGFSSESETGRTSERGFTICLATDSHS
jgi:hypothetical protein